MKTNKSTIANIKEIGTQNGANRYFLVTFITIIEKTIFGRTWTKREEDEVPFVFKTFEIAKDYCQIKPIVVSDVFGNYENEVNGCHIVKYYTYRLVSNGKILGYIKWDEKITLEQDESCNNVIFSWCKNRYPLVDSFVEDIQLKNWVNTRCVADVKFINEYEKLSEMPQKVKRPSNDVYNEWNFKLVENDNK